MIAADQRAGVVIYDVSLYAVASIMPGAVHDIVCVNIGDGGVIKGSVRADLIADIQQYISVQLFYIAGQGRSLEDRQIAALVRGTPCGIGDLVTVIGIALKLIDGCHMLHPGGVIICLDHGFDFLIVIISGGHCGDGHINSSVLNIKTGVVAVFGWDGKKTFLFDPGAHGALCRPQDRIIENLAGNHVIGICQYVIVRVRGKQERSAVFAVFIDFKNNALVSPDAHVIYRCGPEYLVRIAHFFSVCIVGAVNIYPPFLVVSGPEYMGLSVGNMLPAFKQRVAGACLCHRLSGGRIFRVDQRRCLIRVFRPAFAAHIMAQPAFRVSRFMAVLLKLVAVGVFAGAVWRYLSGFTFCPGGSADSEGHRCQ